jgi:hypothetical protein
MFTLKNKQTYVEAVFDLPKLSLFSTFVLQNLNFPK